MKKNEISATVYEFDTVDELLKEDAFLIGNAKEAARQAYAPYSKFQVGVSILLVNNKIINGNNQENAAYPSGLCAERVALFYANARYPDVAVRTIAVCAYTGDDYTDFPVPPCGSCRQALLETEVRFNHPVKMVLAGKNKIYVVNTIKELLPLNFSSSFISR